MDRFELTTKALDYMGIKVNASISTKSVFVRCPFHIDKTPSLSVSLDKGICRCFSCKRGGSIETFFREYIGESLYKVLDIPYDEFSNSPLTPKKKYIEPNYDNLDKDVVIKIEGTISTYKDAALYLRKRAIPFSIAEELGFQFLERGRVNKSLWQNRLLIPVFEKGQLISIEGRTVCGEEPKCKYPKGSSVNTLYQIDKLDTQKPLYLVEGLMDVITLRKYPEFKNSTSMFGAALTPRQLHLLKRFKEVIVIPNNDKAGRNNLLQYQEANLSNVKVLPLPKTLNGVIIKDVNDVDAKSGKTLQFLLDRKWLNRIQSLYCLLSKETTN
jgi:DNA primase